MSPRASGRLTMLAFAVAAAITLVFALNTQLGDPASGLSELLGAWGNAAGGLLCAAVCLARARHAGPDRVAWLLIGLGVASWALGNTYFSVVFVGVQEIPSPSPADALFMGLYPLAYVGIVLLARRRMGHLGIGLWLDGVIATVVATALLGVFVLGAVIDAYDGRMSMALVVNLLYPIGDLVLFALAAGALVLGGRRVSRGTLAGAVAALSFVLADSVYVVGTAKGTYTVGGILDVGWLLGALLIAYAAIVWDPRVAPGPERIRGEATVIVPVAAGLIAAGLLLTAALVPMQRSAQLAAVVAVVLVVARMGATLHENRRMLGALHREASSDALTGLGNRRLLFQDLASAGRRAGETPVGLVVFDLDGFKTYNDTFGHGAGDRLLCRIADELTRTLGTRGRGYRLGGDEFCALLQSVAAEEDVERTGAEIAEQLTQRGDGFTVTASHGAVTGSGVGDGADSLMRRADRRMYEEKHSRRPSAASQAVDALLAIVDERRPSLTSHVSGVTALAHGVAVELGLRDAKLDAVDQAAALHDVGKVAIPDALIDKAGPLSPEEWVFMREHTVIGERVLLAVPALRAAAPLVRASHEHWDGTGYPDGRRGDEIPLGAAIIAACDALDAMLERRPYQAARSLPDAIAELRSCSGTQFAPQVVDALVTLTRQHTVSEQLQLAGCASAAWR